jgi:hypothetical protein
MLTQTDRVPLSALRKLDDLLGDELGSRVCAIDDLQLAQSVFERRDHYCNRIRAECMVLQQAMDRHRIGSLRSQLTGGSPAAFPIIAFPVTADDGAS